MAHMWIADPNKPGVLARLFSTHPPIPDRVNRLIESGRKF
jgi:heat shock protein HtpX